MTELEAHGISLTLPRGWEGRVFRRPVAGEVAASAADGPPAPPGELTHTVVHLATIPLPPGTGDFASGAVEDLGPDDALVVLFEYDPASVGEPLFAAQGMPRQLAPADFSPTVLQRALQGQAGAQFFFQEAGRAFCLYVVLGSAQRRDRVVPRVNEVLATVDLGAGAEPEPPSPTTTVPVPPTVLDAISGRGDLAVFAGLLAEAGLDATLRGAGPFTVFAATDAAVTPEDRDRFAADAELLAATLRAHVANGRLTPEQLRAAASVETLAGPVPVEVGNGAVRVGGAEVEAVPVEAGNGIVYVVGALVEPPR